MLKLELRLGIGGKRLVEMAGNTFPDIVVTSEMKDTLQPEMRYFRYSFTEETGAGVYIEANGILIV